MGEKRDKIWDGDKLHMPPSLLSAYRQVLENNNWQTSAPSNAIGGSSPHDAQEHFRSRFQASAFRLIALSHDPLDRCSPVPIELAQALSTGKLRILDLVCGAGSASLGLLATVAARRASRARDCSPLNVVIQAADFNPECLRLFGSMASLLEPNLAAVGISIQHECTEWNATNPLETQQLLETFLSTHADHDTIVLVSAISGTAGNETDYRPFRTSFEYLKLRTFQLGTLVWIEPRKFSRGEWLLKKIMETYSSFGISERHDIIASYKWFEPFQSKTHNCDIGAILIPKKAS